MISVSRNSHMPKLPASRCCSSVSKWCRCCGIKTCSCSTSCPASCTEVSRGINGSVCAIALSNCGHLMLGLVLQPLVVVGLVVHDRDLGKILGQGRRLNLPLEACCLPGIVAGDRPVLQRPCQVDQGQQIAYAQDGGAGGGEHVEHLELRRIGVVAARHAQVANYELRHEGQVEADECDDRGKLGERLRIHAAGHLGPPEVDAGEECHQHAANHYEVEVR